LRRQVRGWSAAAVDRRGRAYGESIESGIRLAITESREKNVYPRGLEVVWADSDRTLPGRWPSSRNWSMTAAFAW